MKSQWLAISDIGDGILKAAATGYNHSKPLLLQIWKMGEMAVYMNLQMFVYDLELLWNIYS